MDIGILLGLQQFREGPGGFLTEFLTKMTWFGEMNVVLIIIALIYWCADKGTGTYLLMGWVLERRFVRFTTEGTMQQRFFRLTGGLLGYYNRISDHQPNDKISGSRFCRNHDYVFLPDVLYCIPFSCNHYRSSEKRRRPAT